MKENLARVRDTRNAHNILVGTSEGARLLKRRKRRRNYWPAEWLSASRGNPAPWS